MTETLLKAAGPSIEFNLLERRGILCPAPLAEAHLASRDLLSVASPTPGDIMKLTTTLALAGVIAAAFPALAADNELAGTYKLVVEQRTIVDTGEILSIKDPQGFIFLAFTATMDA